MSSPSSAQRPAVGVVIVDDEPLVRMGVRAVLERQRDIVVVGEAGDGAEAIRVCAVTAPDVVLMDLRMPIMDGLEATRRIAGGEKPRVVVLTTFDVDEQVYAALKAGASGFLTKDSPPELVGDAVRSAARGDTLLAPGITRRLVEAYTSMPPPMSAVPERLAPLTPRELEVLTEIARGHTNTQIAHRLYLSEATVKSHITRILAKLAITDRVQAVIAAYECGLIRPGDQP
ncbi:response regulator [uncultured Amnibacterium sp.]|uniref:response regulator n=1 Tax=uncultured Amnibacterium sp. TaxID=1631851 RepID=UPI0035C98B50